MDNIAIFTMSKDEKVFFPIWYKYYSKYFKKQNIYVLDNNTIDDSLKNGYTSLTFPSKRISISQLNKSKFIKIPVRNKFVYDEKWRLKQVIKFRNHLYKLKYSAVIFLDTDEILIPDPLYYKNLKEYLITFLQKKDTFITTSGYEIHSHQTDTKINLRKKILSQRNIWHKNYTYNKPIITKNGEKLQWTVGFHETRDKKYNIDKQLILFHLHKMDYQLSKKKHTKFSKLKWNPNQNKQLTYWYNLNLSTFDKEFDNFWNLYKTKNQKLESIPSRFIKLNIV